MAIFKQQPSRTSNDSDAQAHEEMQGSMMALKTIANHAKAGDEEAALEKLNSLTEKLNHSHLPIGIRDKIISEGKRYTFAVHKVKLQMYYDRALYYTRSGDNENRNVFLKNSATCIQSICHLTDDDKYIKEMEKRLDVIRETSKAGTSDVAKTNQEKETFSLGQGAGKRRFLRYNSPIFLVKLPRESEPYRTLDYSMTGMLLNGIPETLKEGSKIHVTIWIEDEDPKNRFDGSLIVARKLTEKNATALSFQTADGPIMYFIRMRWLDLSERKPI